MAHESEWLTRKKRIDSRLKALGWTIRHFSDSLNLGSLAATAVEELPTKNGPADYGLFVDGKLLGIIEAKKVTVNPQNVLEQAKRYAAGVYQPAGNWDGLRVPFLYATNGTIIWRLDTRQTKRVSRTLSDFHTPINRNGDHSLRRGIILGLFVLLTSLSVSVDVWAENIEKLKSRAAKGTAAEQVNVGLKYSIGDGVNVDKAEAAKWFRMAAEQGDADAQLSLGDMYADGDGVPQDDAEATKWYRMAEERYRIAADQGDANAQYGLGRLYEMGKGIPQDYPEAMKWFRIAAGKRNAEAYEAIGNMYWGGKGVTQDYSEAMKWLRLAADQGGPFVRALSSMTGPGNDSTFMQISVPIQPGNSGGPLLNERGEVVGIISATASVESFFGATGNLPQNVNWAENADFARPALDVPSVPNLGASIGRQEAIEKAKKATYLLTVFE